jgi:hypothetical protein
VVLCAYLGQLAKLRDALANEVAIVIDERDQAALADQEGDDENELGCGITIEHVKVTRRVCIIAVRRFLCAQSASRFDCAPLITIKAKRVE